MSRWILLCFDESRPKRYLSGSRQNTKEHALKQRVPVSNTSPAQQNEMAARFEAQLTHFGFRDYDAATGTFTSRDPIRLSGGMNVYAYAEGKPTGYVDPSGLEVFAADARAKDLIGQLRTKPEGEALFQYLDKSPNIYSVRGNARMPMDLFEKGTQAFGQFNPGVAEGKSQCRSGGNIDLFDKFAKRNRINPVRNLAHELTHAALFDVEHLGRPGAPFPVPAFQSDSSNGALPRDPHNAMDFMWRTVFGDLE
jgi:RHS repeat-associated protein